MIGGGGGRLGRLVGGREARPEPARLVGPAPLRRIVRLFDKLCAITA